MNYRIGIILTLITMLALCLRPAFAQTETPEATVEIEPVVMPTATLGGMALQFVSGRAVYQNRQPDQSGIEVRVLDEALNLIGVAYTNNQGVYAVAAPSNAFYWLVVDAPLHRQQTIPVQPGQQIPDVILAGGDFNKDGCTGPSDLAVLVSALDVPDSFATDVTGDGITDVSDLAIVTGNYQPDCEPFTTPPEATAEVTPESTPESTAEATPEIEVTAELTPEVTPEIEVTAETTAEVEPTQAATSEVTPEVTSEATAEVTPELTPEVTAEIEVTEETTPEVTDEPTAEATEEPPTPILVPTPMLTSTPEPTAIPTLTPEPTPTETPTEIIEEGTEEPVS